MHVPKSREKQREVSTSRAQLTCARTSDLMTEGSTSSRGAFSRVGTGSAFLCVASGPPRCLDEPTELPWVKACTLVTRFGMLRVWRAAHAVRADGNSNSRSMVTCIHTQRFGEEVFPTVLVPGQSVVAAQGKCNTFHWASRGVWRLRPIAKGLSCFTKSSFRKIAHAVYGEIRCRAAQVLRNSCY